MTTSLQLRRRAIDKIVASARKHAENSLSPAAQADFLEAYFSHASADDLKSVLRLIRSRIDLSVQDIFASR